MSYCYCTPRRDMVRVGPGTTPREAGVTYLSNDVVMGSKGNWVYRYQRDAALKGWETRRRLMAEAHARLQAAHPEVVPAPAEHCDDHAEEEKTEEQVIVIETPTTTERKVPAPVALVLV